VVPVQTVNQAIGTPVTSATIGGLLPGAGYSFQVRAVDPNGMEIGVQASTSVGPDPVGVAGVPVVNPTPVETATFGAPTGLAVTSTTATTAGLSWTGRSGATSYQVGQAFSPSGPFSLVAVTGTSSATVGALVPQGTYYFQVRAVDGAGNVSPPSATVSTTTPADFVAATAVSVMGTTATTATLSWTPSSAAKSYQVGQALTPAGPFVPVALTATSMATVGNLTPNTTYYFQVRAIDASGSLGGPSGTASATTTP
jgi:chitodextrinase